MKHHYHTISVSLYLLLSFSFLQAQPGKRTFSPSPIHSVQQPASGLPGPGMRIPGDAGVVDDQRPWREKPGVVKIDFNATGKIIVAKQ